MKNAKAKSFFVLGDDRPSEIGVRIVEGNREAWVFFDKEGTPDLYEKCRAAEDEVECLWLLRKQYRLTCEGLVAGLPHIEDASPAMKLLWEIADATEYEWDGVQQPQPGYTEDDFVEDFGMTSDEFVKQVENDKRKYDISDEIVDKFGRADSLYCVSNKLAEYFSAPVVAS